MYEDRPAPELLYHFDFPGHLKLFLKILNCVPFFFPSNHWLSRLKKDSPFFIPAKTAGTEKRRRFEGAVFIFCMCYSRSVLYAGFAVVARKNLKTINRGTTKG